MPDEPKPFCPHAINEIKERAGQRYDFCTACPAWRPHVADDVDDMPWNETDPRPKKAAAKAKAVKVSITDPHENDGLTVPLTLKTALGAVTLAFPASPTVDDAKVLLRTLKALS